MSKTSQRERSRKSARYGKRPTPSAHTSRFAPGQSHAPLITEGTSAVQGEARVAQLQRALAKLITEEIKDIKVDGHDMAFALLMFPFGSTGRGNYVSNANREDMVKALRDAADRLEAREDHDYGG